MLAALALVLSSCSSGSAGPDASAPATASTSSSPSGSGTTSSGPGGSGASSSGTDWPTYHGDAQRSGRSPSFPAPARLAVASRPQAGRRGLRVTDRGARNHGRRHGAQHAVRPGRIRAPAVEHASRRSRAERGPAVRQHRSSGITGTPVYDPSTGSVFAVAEYRAPRAATSLSHSDLRTGSVRWRTSVDPRGSVPGRDAGAGRADVERQPGMGAVRRAVRRLRELPRSGGGRAGRKRDTDRLHGADRSGGWDLDTSGPVVDSIWPVARRRRQRRVGCR